MVLALSGAWDSKDLWSYSKTMLSWARDSVTCEEPRVSKHRLDLALAFAVLRRVPMHFGTHTSSVAWTSHSTAIDCVSPWCAGRRHTFRMG